MNFVYDEISGALSEGCRKGYKAGLAKVVSLNKKKILKMAASPPAPLQKERGVFDEPLFEISYTGIDERLLQNFEVEAFTVSAVLSYDLEEKLKAIAKSIIDGSHPYLKKNPESDVKELWQDEAYNILADYVEVPDMPPPGHLNTNLRTAVTSSYHAAQYQRLQELKDLYPAYRYKTREDSRVRDAHAKLSNKVFLADDPVWDSIWPPSDWNCRCYVEPLSHDELDGVSPQERVSIDDQIQREEYMKIPAPDFRRNPGKAESIWGKWLQTKLKDKNYDEITDRMKKLVSKMPDPDEVIKQLEMNAEKFRALEYNKENWEREFPENKVNTPLGEYSFDKNFFKKIKERERRSLLGLIKPTMQSPEFVLVDSSYGTLFLKSFELDKKIIYAGVIRSKDGLIISFHQKGNVINKIKNGKLLIYTAQRSTTRGANSPDSFVELPDAVGRLAFFSGNLRKDFSSFNEIWGQFVRPGKTKVIKIKYAVEGFFAASPPTPLQMERGGNSPQEGELKIKFDTYDNIDKYRRGVLM